MLIYLKPNRANGREDEGAFDVCQIGSLYMYRGGRGIGNASCRLEVIRHLIQQPIAFEAIISSVAQSPRNFRSASPAHLLSASRFPFSHPPPEEFARYIFPAP